MPKLFWFCAPLLGLALLPASAGAQAEHLPHVQTGAPAAIVLPKIVVAGERATLSVLDAKGALVPAADVDLSSGAKVSTDDYGRAIFTAPAQNGTLTAKSIETGASATTTVLALSKGTVAPSGVAFPGLIVLGSRFDVFAGGSQSGFSGEAALDRVVVGNLPALVLAASPVSLVALPNPHVTPGIAGFSAGLVSRKLDPENVTVISLEVTGPANGMAAGQPGALVVRVYGTAARLGIEVQNMTPQVVELPHGEVEHLVSTGGAANFATVQIAGLEAGDYSVSARIEPYVDAPTVAAALQELFAAWQAADAKWRKRLDPLIRAMNRSGEPSPHEVERLRQRLQDMVREKPPEAPAALLRLAWQMLGTTN